MAHHIAANCIFLVRPHNACAHHKHRRPWWSPLRWLGLSVACVHSYPPASCAEQVQHQRPAPPAPMRGADRLPPVMQIGDRHWGTVRDMTREEHNAAMAECGLADPDEVREAHRDLSEQFGLWTDYWRRCSTECAGQPISFWSDWFARNPTPPAPRRIAA